ncbi:MAG TPA: GNAT family N-acetyltransferase [Phycisphaerae bacterium]|nr:GNAT family N-acetyltransferase [Phycisphaerae bacterium]
MPAIEIRDMTADDEAFVGPCTHIDEAEEWTASGKRRATWLRAMHAKGARTKVALLDGAHAGFLHCMPIEHAPWGPLGRDLMVVPCLAVKDDVKGRGVGSALLAAAEDETRRQGLKGLVTTGWYHDFWFMPGPWFERRGFTVVARQDTRAILWKVYDPTAEPPGFLKRNWEFVPVEGKVAVDLFWMCFCLTSDSEAQRVREVAAEFGNKVVLREYSRDDQEAFMRHQTGRAIFVNGKEIGWGYEAPREGVREAIDDALRKA